MRSVCVVIPCYNEEAVLPQLFTRLSAAANTWGLHWSALCIDDGSTDDTWTLIETQAKNDPHWQGLRLSRNFGHQPAVSAGLAHARADAVIILDADLQDPPEIIDKFIKKWQEGYEVVYAIRTKRKEGFFKRLGYWAFYRLMSRLVDFKLPLDTGDFCLMDKKVVNALNTMPERSRFIRGLRAWTGFRQVGLAYERAARAAGTPKYNFRRLIKLGASGIFSFSTVPLRMVSTLGFWISGLAFVGMSFTLVQRLFKDHFEAWGFTIFPGYATIVTSILFIGGIQLICLGVIGEYIGRIYDEVKGRPTYLVANQTKSTTSKEDSVL